MTEPLDFPVALVVTSIASPNDCLRALAAASQARDARFIVIGDLASPADFALDGCDYYSPARQRGLGLRYAELCPWRHYARKNIGYLEAIRGGAKRIYETDDDNYPLLGFWLEDLPLEATRVTGDGWFNVYRWYGADAWPRGFPLELAVVWSPGAFLALPDVHSRPLVWQGLVDNDPDVDAIYRMTRASPVEFHPRGLTMLDEGVWCPFNSQNTAWERSAFPLLYLPATCSFRATDIVRGYVALRCLEAMGSSLAFTGLTARQLRNQHDLMRDFRDELVIYLHAAEIRRRLREIKLGSMPDDVSSNVRACYESLASMGVVESRELPLLEAWISDLDRVQSADFA